MIHGNVSKDPPQTSASLPGTRILRVPPSTFNMIGWCFIHYFFDWFWFTIQFTHSTSGRHSNAYNTTTMIQAAEEESEAEVRRVDQDNINKFARLNARLHELRDERDLLKVRSPLPPPSPWSSKKRHWFRIPCSCRRRNDRSKANADLSRHNSKNKKMMMKATETTTQSLLINISFQSISH